MKTIAQLIKGKKFNYVEERITHDLFADQSAGTSYKVFSFKTDVTSTDAVQALADAGYKPATLRDLLTWSGWRNGYMVIALGSLAPVNDAGYQSVPALFKTAEVRVLVLNTFEGTYPHGTRFLGAK